MVRQVRCGLVGSREVRCGQVRYGAVRQVRFGLVRSGLVLFGEVRQVRWGEVW